MTTENKATEGEHGHQESGHSLTVTVHNEDQGGKPITIKAGSGTPVREIIEQMYKELKIQRQQGDRLTCLANGQDVFQHANEHLGDYQRSSCSKLEWGFARPTGGA